MFELVFNVIFVIAVLVINLFILMYLDHLEKTGCECAKDWRKTYAYAYLIVSIILPVAIAILSVLSMRDNVSSQTRKGLNVAYLVLKGIMIVATILYIIFSLQYIHKLKEIKCQCSKDIVRQVWEIVLYIQVALMFLGLLIAVLVVLFVKNIIKKLPFSSELKLDKIKEKYRSKK